jgi:hypothetical protein
MSKETAGCREEARMADDLGPDGSDLERGDEDHDLLTFAEGGIRLREEIALTEAALREAGSDASRAALRSRLEALADALARNTRQAAASPGEQGFLDYRPPRRGSAAADGQS